MTFERKTKNLVIIGTGEGVLYSNILRFVMDQNIETFDVLYFQEGYKSQIFDDETSLLFYSDPSSVIEALRQDLNFKKIIVPWFMTQDFATFRMFCGTTPLGRIPGGYSEYLDLLNRCKERVEIIDGTTTKYLESNPYSEPELSRDFLESGAQSRFQLGKPVFGSVRFDSESVVGSRYLWGLESKLSSYVFPLAHHLGYENLYITGFGMIGGRFFESEKTRMPFNDETQSKDEYEIPLSIIEKWTKDWKPFHNMNMFSLEPDECCHLNKVMSKYR